MDDLDGIIITVISPYRGYTIKESHWEKIKIKMKEFVWFPSDLDIIEPRLVEIISLHDDDMCLYLNDQTREDFEIQDPNKYSQFHDWLAKLKLSEDDLKTLQEKNREG